MTVGGRSQGVGKFLQGRVAGDYILCFRNMGPFGVNISNRIEGMHTAFLRMITGKRVKILGDGTWETPGAEYI